MKIMFCLGSMTKGGAERVIANLSNYLIENYDISIVVTPPDDSSYILDKRINYYTLDNKKEINIFHDAKIGNKNMIAPMSKGDFKFTIKNPPHT